MSDQTAGHGLKGSQINIFSTEYRNKNYFLIENEDLTQLNKLTLLPMCGFIAQLVEHRTGIAEVMGSNPVEALIFFQASSFQ